MSNPSTNLKVKIGGDLADIKSALAGLRGDLVKVKKEAATVNTSVLNKGLDSLKTSILGLASAGAVFYGLKAGIGAIITSTIEAEKAQAQLNSVLKSTGNAAGLTADEINRMADELQRVTAYDDEAIIGAQSLLLTFTSIGRDVFPAATKAILDMSTALGQDLQSTTTQVGKALQDPIAGISALKRVGVNFTQAQKDVIKSLVETGDVAAAQTLILQELQKEYGGSAEAAANTLGGALDQLKNSFDNLLEGDTGGSGIKGSVGAIKELTAIMQSPETKSAFQSLINDLAELTTGLAKAVLGYQSLRQQIGSQGAGSFLGGGLTGIASAIPSIIAQRFKPKATPQINGATRRGGAPQGGRTPFVQVQTGQIEAEAKKAEEARKKAEAEAEAARKRGDAAAEKSARDRVAAAEKAAEAIRKLNEEEEQDTAARNKRITEGLAEAEIELLRSTGNEFDAVKKEIEAKYKELIQDLTLQGNTEGAALIKKLMGAELAEAELNEIKTKMSNILGELRSETEFINNQSELPNGLTQTAAEEQLQAARDVSIAQLTELRDIAMQAYNARPTPETLQVLRELDNNIGQITQSQNLLAETAQDEGVQALQGFFYDLATGAKSFKDAFLDAVRSFVAGIAQMISQQLALNAVKAISKAFSVSHTGGMAGIGGAKRTLSPMVFAGAPRFHSGGVAGLKAGEVPAILQTGERVLSRNETQKYNAGSRPAPGTRIVNVFDPSFIPDQMDSAEGEKVILNVIGKNPGRIKQLIG